jgi:phytoene synthase
MEQAFQYCQQRVREADKDRFLASLFAPQECRGPLFALYAFDLEVARVRDRITSPLPGEVRLQYWHDLLGGTLHGDAAANPVAAALLDTIRRYSLSPSALRELIEARRFDLYDTPMASVAALERYCLATSATVIRLAATIVTGGAPHADALFRHAGLAAGFTAVLCGLPLHAMRGQCYLPGDVLDRHGVAVSQVLARQANKGLRSALAELRASVRRQLAALRAELTTAPASLLPAVLSLSPVPVLLARMEREDYDPFQPPIIPQWRRQWTLWRAARHPPRIAG